VLAALLHGSRICLCRLHPSYSIRLSPLTAADTHTLSIQFVSSPTAGSPLDAPSVVSSLVLVVSNTVVVWSRLTPQVSPQSRTVIRPTTPRTRSTPTTSAHNPWCVCRCKPAAVTIPPCHDRRLRADYWMSYLATEKTVHARKGEATEDAVLSHSPVPVSAEVSLHCPSSLSTSRSRVVHRWSKYRMSLMVHDHDAV
jgi:hypothetical protein